MREWLLKQFLTYAVRNYRTLVPGLIAAFFNLYPPARDFLLAHGYSLEELNGIAILAIGFLAKDASVSNAITPGAPQRVPAAAWDENRDPRDAPPGFARLGLLVLLGALLAGALALAPGRARAADPTAGTQDTGAIVADAVANSYPDRKFGGCSRSGFFCAGPSGTVSLVAWDLKLERWVTGFQPTLAYGFDLWAADWWRMGLSVGAGVAMQNGVMSSGTLSATLSFAEYLRFGYALEVIGSTDTVASSRKGFLLFGFGANFGS
jgi:hypothetical protein